ncbi:MAG: hypothetical protein ABIP30_13790 [Ferruginibacter sp.]
MQRSFKTKNLLQWAAVLLLSTTLAVACESKDTKTTDTKAMETTTTVQGPTDSVPPLVVDSNTKTKPETIKNPPPNGSH